MLNCNLQGAFFLESLTRMLSPPSVARSEARNSKLSQRHSWVGQNYHVRRTTLGSSRILKMDTSDGADRDVRSLRHGSVRSATRNKKGGLRWDGGDDRHQRVDPVRQMPNLKLCTNARASARCSNQMAEPQASGSPKPHSWPTSGQALPNKQQLDATGSRSKPR